MGPRFRVSDLLSLRWCLRVFIFNQFLSDTATIGSGSALWKSLPPLHRKALYKGVPVNLGCCDDGESWSFAKNLAQKGHSWNSGLSFGLGLISFVVVLWGTEKQWWWTCTFYSLSSWSLEAGLTRLATLFWSIPGIFEYSYCSDYKNILDKALAFYFYYLSL